MIEQGIRFEPTDPPDPEDIRVVPADMRFAPLLRNGRAYVSWKISDSIRLNESRVPPTVLTKNSYLHGTRGMHTCVALIGS